MLQNDKLVGRLRNWLSQIDWALLLFLAAAANVKLYIKIAAVVVYAVWMVFKRVKWYRMPGPAWFYLVMPVLGIAVAALHGSFHSAGYTLGAAIGTMQWLTGAGIVYLLFIGIKNSKVTRSLATVKGFFALNGLVTIIQFGGLIVASKHIMPYWFYDDDLKYGAGTGDALMGLFMQNSLNNAAAMLVGVIFFLTRCERLWTCMCITVVLMCTSNVVTFGMLAIFILLLLLGSGKKVRVYALQMLLLVVVVYPALSPQNLRYIKTIAGRLFTPAKPFITAETAQNDTLISDSEIITTLFAPKRALSLHMPDSIYNKLPAELVQLREHSLHMDKPRWSRLTLEPIALREAFHRWYGVAPDATLLAHYGKPAKLFAIRQTLSFLNTGKTYWLAGAGMGNFSSKLASKMTGLRWQGQYPDNRIYVARPFAEYHLYTLLYVFSRDVREHSVVNMPAGTYVQLGGNMVSSDYPFGRYFI